MIEIGILAVALAIVLVVGLSLVLDRAGVASDVSGTLGTAFMGPQQTPRARGIQEEDVPHFVFRNAAPAAC